MSKKTLALILGLIILTLVLLGVALLPILRQNQTTEPVPTPTSRKTTLSPTPPAFTTITLSPNPVTLAQTGTVNVIVDTGGNSLTAVQLEIAYDPTYLTNVSIQPGTFFPNPVQLLNTVDDQTGRVTYALGITPAQTPISGSGTVATIMFQRTLSAPAGQTQLDLLPKTLVTQQGSGASVLKATTGTTIIIAEDSTISSPPTQETSTTQTAQ